MNWKENIIYKYVRTYSMNNFKIIINVALKKQKKVLSNMYFKKIIIPDCIDISSLHR